MLKLGVTGFPLTYTKSPGLHRGFLRRAGIKGVYDVLPFDPALGKAAFFRFLEGKRKEGYVGLNVTVPHKEWAYEYAARRGGVTQDFHGRCARRVKAANTLVFSVRGVRAANTDAHGLWSTVGTWAPLTSAKALDVLVVGTGGSARGALAGILERHPDAVRVRAIEIWGRQRLSVLALGRLMSKQLRAAWGDESRPLLVLWCLPPVASSVVKAIWKEAAGHEAPARVFFYDLNYGARARGTAQLVARARRREGLSMLRAQAEAAFNIWRASTKGT